MDRVAVLASGGLDSSVLIADLARNAEVYPIYIQWGFPWEAVERASLEAFLSALDSPRTRSPVLISMPIKTVYGDHWSLNGASVPSEDDPDTSVFLPGRNILLIGLAAVWCSTHGVSRIAIGSLGGNPFPDATPEFFDRFAGTLSTGLGHRIIVEAPFRGLHKSDIIRQFKELPLELTITCMAPANGQHCGRCNKCAERRNAFLASDVPDRTIYSAS